MTTNQEKPKQPGVFEFRADKNLHFYAPSRDLLRLYHVAVKAALAQSEIGSKEVDVKRLIMALGQVHNDSLKTVPPENIIAMLLEEVDHCVDRKLIARFFINFSTAIMLQYIECRRNSIDKPQYTDEDMLNAATNINLSAWMTKDQRKQFLNGMKKYLPFPPSYAINNGMYDGVPTPSPLPEGAVEMKAMGGIPQSTLLEAARRWTPEMNRHPGDDEDSSYNHTVIGYVVSHFKKLAKALKRRWFK